MKRKKAVEHVVSNKLWERLRIPPAWGDYITTVWRRNDPTLDRQRRRIVGSVVK